jgi:hypothetical protein
MSRIKTIFLGILLPFTLAGCLGGTVTKGSGGTAVSGAAGGGTSVDAAADLERCSSPLGTLAFDDGRESYWYADFSRRTRVTDIEPLLRLHAQQTNCFIITSLGNTRLEGRISEITDRTRNSGEFRAGSNFQRGQRVAADYFMEPAIIVEDSAIGGVAGALGGLIGSEIGALAGALDVKSSVVTLSLFDIRSGVQVVAAEGSSTSTNYGAAVGALGGSLGGAVGGYSSTPEGQAVVAAFTDAFNGLVIAARNYEAQNVPGGLGTGGQLQVN